MSNSTTTLRDLLIERIQHLRPGVYDDYDDRDLLEELEDALTEFIEQQAQ